MQNDQGVAQSSSESDQVFAAARHETVLRHGKLFSRHMEFAGLLHGIMNQSLHTGAIAAQQIKGEVPRSSRLGNVHPEGWRLNTFRRCRATVGAGAEELVQHIVLLVATTRLRQSAGSIIRAT